MICWLALYTIFAVLRSNELKLWGTKSNLSQINNSDHFQTHYMLLHIFYILFYFVRVSISYELYNLLHCFDIKFILFSVLKITTFNCSLHFSLSFNWILNWIYILFSLLVRAWNAFIHVDWLNHWTLTIYRLLFAKNRFSFNSEIREDGKFYEILKLFLLNPRADPAHASHLHFLHVNPKHTKNWHWI